jgi:hypothetical protein
LERRLRLSFELCNERKEFKAGQGGEAIFNLPRVHLQLPRQRVAAPVYRRHDRLQNGGRESPGPEAVLGKACLLNVVHTTGEPSYANIQNASPLPKGMAAPELFNPMRIADINSTPFELIDTLPEFIQKKMKSSEEYAARLNLNDKLDEAGLQQAPGQPVRQKRPQIAGGPAPEAVINLDLDEIEGTGPGKGEGGDWSGQD